MAAKENTQLNLNFENFLVSQIRKLIFYPSKMLAKGNTQTQLTTSLKLCTVFFMYSYAYLIFQQF